MILCHNVGLVSVLFNHPPSQIWFIVPQFLSWCFKDDNQPSFDLIRRKILFKKIQVE